MARQNMLRMRASATLERREVGRRSMSGSLDDGSCGWSLWKAWKRLRMPGRGICLGRGSFRTAKVEIVASNFCVFLYQGRILLELKQTAASSWRRQPLGYARDNAVVRTVADADDAGAGGARPSCFGGSGPLPAVRGDAFGCAGCSSGACDCVRDGYGSGSGAVSSFSGTSLALHAVQSTPSNRSLRCLDGPRLKFLLRPTRFRELLWHTLHQPGCPFRMG